MTKPTSRRPRMGAFSSKKRERKWHWTGPPGDHSPFPLDPVPYPGPAIFYCFVDFMTSYRFMHNEVNLGPQVVTTNVEEHLDEMRDCYEQGFYLNDFVKVPGVRSTTAVQNWDIKEPFQAILSKPTVRPFGAENEHWQLKIEKRVLSTSALTFGEADDGSDSFANTIDSYAALGARLVCATSVGYVRTDSINKQYGAIGVELFFNMPKHPAPTQYAYHAAKVPANYNIVPDATQTVQTIVSDVDFMGQLKLFLDKGWKLVNICIDSNAISEAYRMKATSKAVNTIWIFEKERDRLYDDSAQYEGVIIEYFHKVKITRGGELPCKDWRAVIAGMGVGGWELASIIQTPLLIQSSFTTYTMKLLMVFQRRIIASFEKLKRMKLGNSLPCLPDGDAPSTSKSAGGGVIGTRRASAGTEGYYHGTLQKYIYGMGPESNGPTPKLGSSSSSSSISSSISSSNNIISINDNQSRSRSRSRSWIVNGESPPPYWEAVQTVQIPVT